MCVIGNAQYSDTLTAVDSFYSMRFVKDEAGQSYLIEYHFAETANGLTKDEPNRKENHAHFIANCTIIRMNYTKNKIIAQNIKAIYSLMDCAADNNKLWLDRIKKYVK